MRLLQRLLSRWLPGPSPVLELEEVRHQARRVRQAINGSSSENPERILEDVLRVVQSRRRSEPH